ncbi:MAG TPA: hypothetical protein VIE43_07850 [Thermoanaerobaculia bacterium]|jgi:tetratricopeptide (TPR) repeat protein|nr:hypothetical protein [Thermoanaerobaculia bacterium]
MTQLDQEQLRALVANRLDPAERRRVVRHLRSGCTFCEKLIAKCLETFSGEMTPAIVTPEHKSLDAVFDHVLAKISGHEARCRKDQVRLRRALALIREHPQGYDGLSLQQVKVFHGWPLIEALLRLSFEARFRDPQAMRLLAYHAMTAAESLLPEEYSRELARDLQARAWAELGNAYRINDEFQEAETAFERARARLREGTGDLLLLVRVADLEASLRSAQRRLPEASELLDRIYRLHLNLGDAHLAGRALISKGRNIHYDGNPLEALCLFREGLALIDSGRDPQLTAIGQQCLLHALVDCGEFREASRLLIASGLRQVFASDPIVLLKLRVIEGKILAGLGKLDRAERVLDAVRTEFLRREQHHEAALMGLELAAVRLRQGKVVEVCRLAEDMLETFVKLGIPREAVKALRCLREACRLERATVQLVGEICDFLTRLQRQPHLRFELA